MVAVHDKPILVVHTVAEWERFLEGHPAADGVRLQLRKISSPMPGITYAEALDAALCFGWIDGQRSALDDNYHLQVFTPRRPRSIWSQRNRDHVERLTAEGRADTEPLADNNAAEGRAKNRRVEITLFATAQN